MYRDKSEMGKIIGAVLLGITAGTAITLLFAPDSGVNARQKIADLGEYFAATMKNRWDQLLQDLYATKDNLKQSGGEIAQHAELPLETNG